MPGCEQVRGQPEGGLRRPADEDAPAVAEDLDVVVGDALLGLPGHARRGRRRLLPVSGRSGISEASETVRRAGAETLPAAVVGVERDVAALAGAQLERGRRAQAVVDDAAVLGAARRVLEVEDHDDAGEIGGRRIHPAQRQRDQAFAAPFFERGWTTASLEGAIGASLSPAAAGAGADRRAARPGAPRPAGAAPARPEPAPGRRWRP